MRLQTHSDRDTGKPETEGEAWKDRDAGTETAEGHGERGWEKHGVSWRQRQESKTVALGTRPAEGEERGKLKGERSSPALVDSGKD